MATSRIQSLRDSLRWWFGLLASVWLAAAVVVLAVGLTRTDTGLSWPVLLYAGVTVVASLFAFGAYGLDKRRAVRDGRRIPERVLQASALLGGWPGAFLAQQVFRHKTLKASFRLVFWGIVLLHAAAFGWCVWHVVQSNRSQEPVTSAACRPVPRERAAQGSCV